MTDEQSKAATEAGQPPPQDQPPQDRPASQTATGESAAEEGSGSPEQRAEEYLRLAQRAQAVVSGGSIDARRRRIGVGRRRFAAGGRLVRHARYFTLQLAESYLTASLFRLILARIGVSPRTGAPG